MSALESLSNKKVATPILLVLLFGTSGLGINNHFTNAEITTDADKISIALLEHEVSENPHPVTTIKLDNIHEDVREIKTDLKELTKLTQEILLHSYSETDICNKKFC